MAKSKNVKLEDFANALNEELTIYHGNIIEAIDAAGAKAVKALVKKTRATAPKNRPEYHKAIASKLLKKTNRGSIYAWYVKAPYYRLTHLLVRGHAKKNGGRTKADPFLKNALADVLPEYERDIEEALKNGK